MKYFNNIKLVSSFRQISNALEIISNAIKIFAFLLIILQGVFLFMETKKNV